MVGGGRPFLHEIWVKLILLEENADFHLIFTCSSSAITPSEKSLIHINKFTTHFPVSLRWTSYFASKPPRGSKMQSVQIWTIICDNFETVWDRMLIALQANGWTVTVVERLPITTIMYAKYCLPGTVFCARQHPSDGDCLEVKREYYQNCFVLGCVTQCSQSAAHSCEQFLQV